MPKRRATPEENTDNIHEIALPEVLEMTDPNINVRYIPMTDEEKQEWAHQWASLCLDAYEREHGPLPPPPNEEEFNRIWNEIINEQNNGDHSL